MRTAENEFAVLLHGRRIGALRRQGDFSRFTFDEAYLADPDRAVLGLGFEEDLRARYAAHLRLPPWFSNLLPEGRIREWIAEARGTSSAREMELLAELGHDLPGAVQVFETQESLAERPARHEVVARAAREIPETMWRFSLAGVALKFSARAADDRFTAPAVGERGDWILKLPDANHEHVPLNEFAMMTLASRAGIEVPEVRLVHRDRIEPLPDSVWPRGEQFAFAVRRFDRDTLRNPVHIEELAQVKRVYPDDKYRGSFESVAALVYRRRDVSALREFVRRLTFNILIENGDAHFKNWALIYRDRRVPTLAPAYDLVAASMYAPRGDPANLGLKFCRSRRFEAITLGCFEALRAHLGAPVPLAEDVLQCVEEVEAAWPEVAASFGEHPAMARHVSASISTHAARLRRR